MEVSSGGKDSELIHVKDRERQKEFLSLLSLPELSSLKQMWLSVNS